MKKICGDFMKIYKKLFCLIISIALLTGSLSVPTFAAQTKIMPLSEGRIELTDFGFYIIDANCVFWAYTFGENPSKYQAYKIAENVKEFSEVHSEDYYYLKNDGTVWYVDIERGFDNSTGMETLKFGTPVFIAENCKRLSSAYIITNNGILYQIFEKRDDTTGKFDYALNLIAHDIVDIDGSAVLKKDSIWGVTAVGTNPDSSSKFDLHLSFQLPFSNASKIYDNYWRVTRTGVSYVICENGDLWSWGNNQRGEAGHGNYYKGVSLGKGFGQSFTIGEINPVSAALSDEPRKILTNVKKIYFSQNGNDTWAVKNDNTVWHWGDGDPIECITYSGDKIDEVFKPDDWTGYTPREDAIPEYFEFSESYGSVRVWLNGNLQFCSNYEWVNLPRWYDEIYLTTSSGQTFKDVKVQDYFFDTVKWAADNGITSGTSNTTFSPDKQCTHAEILTFLWRSQNSPDANIKIDINEDLNDQYWVGAYKWAIKKTLLSDYDYKVMEKPCTRADVVYYLWKLEGMPKKKAMTMFSDVNSDSQYAQAVYWAVENKITNGTSSNTFSPNESCTRAQIVTFLYRYLIQS